jgi:NADH-quinone oxidoreductase subunit G
VVVSSRPVLDDPRVEVVLPMAHPYERQATLINLEGRLQFQEAGAAPPRHARTDWGIVAELGQQLDLPGPWPAGLEQIRSMIAEEHPKLAPALKQEVLLARV